MTIYEDEWAFWDDIAGKYVFKHADTDQNVSKVIDAAGIYADLMVVARRKRRAGKIPEGDMPRVPVTAASFRMDDASK